MSNYILKGFYHRGARIKEFTVVLPWSVAFSANDILKYLSKKGITDVVQLSAYKNRWKGKKEVKTWRFQ